MPTSREKGTPFVVSSLNSRRFGYRLPFIHKSKSSPDPPKAPGTASGPHKSSAMPPAPRAGTKSSFISKILPPPFGQPKRVSQVKIGPPMPLAASNVQTIISKIPVRAARLAAHRPYKAPSYDPSYSPPVIPSDAKAKLKPLILVNRLAERASAQ